MGKKVKLVLIPSSKMDNNKKEDRNEHGLVRMSKATRSFLGFDDKVELYPDTSAASERLRGSVLLDIFQAFAEDIQIARKQGLSEEELKRAGFVTSKTFRRITGSLKDIDKNIYITKDVNDTVIGADPEFLLFDKSGKVIRANNVLTFEKPIGCDGAMAELRPDPAISPEDLTHNIKTLLKNKDFTGPIEKLEWMAGCYYKDDMRDYPIGGHIHIGNPAKIASLSMDSRRNLFKSFNKILDELLAIPMIKVDGTKLGRARRSESAIGKFGYFGEFRLCQGRMEYRTLSGLWLMHPDLTTLVFGTAKAIIDEIYRHIADNDYNMEYMFPKKFSSTNVWGADFNDWKNIPLTVDLDCMKSSKEMIDLLNNSPANLITMKFLNAWYSKMKRLTTYDLYSKYIDGLYEVLKTKTSDFEKFNKKLQDNWLSGAKFLT